MRSLLLVQNMKLTSTQAESDVRELQAKTVFIKDSNITGGLFMTPQFKKHNKDIKAYLVPSRRFGGVDDTPLYVPDMRLTDDAQLISLLERADASNLHNRTLQEKGVATDDTHRQHDTLLIDQSTITDQTTAAQTGGENELEFTQQEIEFLEQNIQPEIGAEEEKLDELELTAERRLVLQFDEIIRDDETFRVILSLIPNPTSGNQIHVRNLLEQQLSYSRTVEIAGIPSGERHKLQHNLISMEATLKKGAGGNRKYKGWILASLEITDRQIKVIKQRDGHAILDDTTPIQDVAVEESGAVEDVPLKDEQSNLN